MRANPKLYKSFAGYIDPRIGCSSDTKFRISYDWFPGRQGNGRRGHIRLFVHHLSIDSFKIYLRKYMNKFIHGEKGSSTHIPGSLNFLESLKRINSIRNELFRVGMYHY